MAIPEGAEVGPIVDVVLELVKDKGVTSDGDSVAIVGCYGYVVNAGVEGGQV